MSQLAQPQNCTQTCASPEIVTTPGAAGADGAAGAAGADGANAYSVLTDGFTIPGELLTVTVDVDQNDYAFVGLVVQVETAGTANVAGFYEVTAIPDGTSLTIQNLRDSGTDAYLINKVAGTVATGRRIVPCGIQGPQGVAGAALGAAPDDATYITQSPNADLTSEQALNLLANGILSHTAGVVASLGHPLPVANGGSGATTAAGARTNLGLGTIAIQNANNVAITGGTITGVNIAGTAITPANAAMAAWDADWSLVSNGGTLTKAVPVGVHTITFSNTVAGKTINLLLTYNGANTLNWPGMKWASASVTGVGAGTAVFVTITLAGGVYIASAVTISWP